MMIVADDIHQRCHKIFATHYTGGAKPGGVDLS